VSRLFPAKNFNGHSSFPNGVWERGNFHGGTRGSASADDQAGSPVGVPPNKHPLAKFPYLKLLEPGIGFRL
jgi:hypothetical protein